MLWPPDRPRLAGDDVIAAQRHMETCAACQREAQLGGTLVAAFDRLREAEAPHEVRARVSDVITSERARTAPDEPRHVSRRRVALAAAFALLAIAGASLIPTGQQQSAEDEASVTAFVDDYVRRAVREDHIVTSDPAEVRRFLARELGLPLGPIDVPGFTLAGAEVCLLEGRRGAMILYKRDGDVVSYYILPHQHARARPPEARAETGTTVVTWATRSFEHALVGPLGSEAMLEVALVAGR